MNNAWSQELARYRVGDRTVYPKYFRDPDRGFAFYEVRQIAELEVGERLEISGHSIERLPDARHPSAVAVGILAGLSTFLAGTGWLLLSCSRAWFQSEGWLYLVSAKLNALGDRFADTVVDNLFGQGSTGMPSGDPVAWVLLSPFVALFVFVGVLGASAMVATVVTEFANSLLQEKSRTSRAVATLSIIVPICTATTLALCMAAGLGLAESMAGAGVVIGAGLLVDHLLTRKEAR